VRYLPYRELQANREAIMRFGKGLQPVEALTRDLSRADSTATPSRARSKVKTGSCGISA